jgi:hypothetical protein
MKKITYEEAAKADRGFASNYMHGYNACVDLANAEIQAFHNHYQELGNKQKEYVRKCYNTIDNLNEKLRTVADKSYQYGFNDMAMSASEQIKQLTKERDMYHDVLMAYEDPPKLSPEMKDLLSKPSITDDISFIQGPLKRVEKLEELDNAFDRLIDKVSKLEEDFTLKHLSEYSYDLSRINDRLDKLESSAVMDGDGVEIRWGYSQVQSKGVITKSK